MLDAPRLRTVADREPATAQPTNEAELVERAIGDRQAFAPLYARYVDPIYRYCFRRLGNHDAAEDATSQVFANALAALPRYRIGAGSFRSWLFTIAHNVVTDSVRGTRLHRSLTVSPEIADASPTPDEAAAASDDRRTLLGLLEQLPDEQRRVVELHLVGLNGRDIAGVLGHSHAAVRKIQSRAIARLRSLLRGYE